MNLHFQRSGSGEPLIILHGLFGSLDNLGTAAKALSDDWDTIAVDLRNHGRSDHSDEVGYPAMAADVIDLADQLDLTQFHLLGHSMGGKVAMELCLSHPERVASLIVVDIAPVEYPHHHQAVIRGLRSIPLEQIKSRAEADQVLAHSVETASVRAFLLKNLIRSSEGGFRWRMNLDALEHNYDKIRADVRQGLFEKPVLFIKGALSEYITLEYQKAVLDRFPNAKMKVIEQTGHWPHAEKPQIFIRLVQRFLKDSGFTSLH